MHERKHSAQRAQTFCSFWEALRTRNLRNCRTATISEPRLTEPKEEVKVRLRLPSTTLVAREPKKYHEAKAPATVTCTALETNCHTQKIEKIRKKYCACSKPFASADAPSICCDTATMHSAARIVHPSAGTSDAAPSPSVAGWRLRKASVVSRHAATK